MKQISPHLSHGFQSMNLKDSPSAKSKVAFCLIIVLFELPKVKLFIGRIKVEKGIKKKRMNKCPSC